MITVKQRVKAYLELCKIRISFFSALSSASGFVLASSEFRWEMFVTISGVFLLACGASALNQFQERDVDALMERTRSRPLPSNRIRPAHSLYLSAALMFSGLAVLFLTRSLLASLLGLSAVLWYNGMYTYLKRKTAFAAVPGALVGVIPPAIGWVLGGGALNDPRLSAICFLFFMWQVPHFWVLALGYGKEYERAGLPSVSLIFSRKQLERIISQWVFAMLVSSLFVSLYGLVHSSLMNFFVFAASAWCFPQAVKLLGKNEHCPRDCRVLFGRINYYMALVVLFVSFDRLVYSWC
jgi:protoheme IX farnesyltransferase